MNSKESEELKFVKTRLVLLHYASGDFVTWQILAIFHCEGKQFIQLCINFESGIKIMFETGFIKTLIGILSNPVEQSFRKVEKHNVAECQLFTKF